MGQQDVAFSKKETKCKVMKVFQPISGVSKTSIENGQRMQRFECKLFDYIHQDEPDLKLRCFVVIML